MKIAHSVRSRFGRFGVLVVAVLLVTAWSVPSAVASDLAHKKKGLSLATITITGSSTSAAPSAVWIAQRQGFFKDQGLNLTYLPSPTSSAQVAILISGGAQFDVDAPSADLPAVQQGAPLRGILMISQGSDGEIVLTQAAATEFGVPTTGDSTASVTKQFLALKGSHLIIAVSSTTSGSYGTLALAAKVSGLTMGVGCTTCDLDITTVGSPANQTADVEAGKVPAMTGVPPNTVIPSPPATVTIQLQKYLPPLPDAAGNFMGTTTTMIQQHADTVQAVVTAMVRADYWLKSHPSQAEKDAAVGLASYVGITSPEEQEYLYAGVAPTLPFPYPTKKAFNYALEESDITLATPIAVTYSNYVVPRFAAEAGKVLGVKLN